MSMTACWPAFPSTTAPCANAASAFTPAPSLALIAHAHTAHPRVWVPAPRRPTAPSPPHRARSSPPSRFSPSSSVRPPTPREDGRVIRGRACAHTPGTCCRWDLQAQRGRHLPVQSSSHPCPRWIPDAHVLPRGMPHATRIRRARRPPRYAECRGVGAKYLALSPVAVYSRKGMAGVEGSWACR
ncbi:hypothetical protein B0H13DRAFT_2096142 [Mycena leptocephala]|nr:hypothetical protein B0H13DRAFT_2096142 [Mycena leptocephala]